MSPHDWQFHLARTGAGPTVVLLHGLLTDSTVWQPLTARLSHRYHLVAVDAPGHGRTPPRRTRYTLENEVDALASVLRESDIPRPATWVGHSMGGMKAMHAYLRHPDLVDALVLISTQPYAEPERTSRPYLAMVEAAKTWGISPDLAEVIGKLNFHPSFLRSGPGRRWLAHFANLNGDDIEAACHSVFDRADISDRVGEIRVPTLVIHGADDIPIRITVARRYAETIPGAELVELAGCAHTPPCDQPELTTYRIERFLDRLECNERPNLHVAH